MTTERGAQDQDAGTDANVIDASEGAADTSTTPQTPSGKVFTQEELNAVVAERLGRERAKYQDYAHLKERAELADKLEEAALTEQEKLQKRVADAEMKAAAADQRIADTAIQAEVKVKAVQMGIVDPDAAYALLDRSGINYTDGSVVGVDDALDALIEAKPYLKGHGATAPNLNAGNGTLSDPPPKLTDAERETARRFGMSDEDYAKHRPQRTNPSPGQ